MLDEATKILLVLTSNEDATYSSGITLSYGVAGVGQSFSIGYAIDSQGNIAIPYSFSDRVGAVDAGLFAGKYETITNANTVLELKGQSTRDYEIDEGYIVNGVPLAGSVEYSVFGFEDIYHATTVNYGFGTPGVSILYGTTDTGLIVLNNSEYFRLKSITESLTQ